MDIHTVVSIISIIGGGGLIGIIGKVIKMSMEYQKLKTKTDLLDSNFLALQKNYETLTLDYNQIKTRFENNEKRDEEERKENNAKFAELYNSRNKTNETLTELSTTIKMLVSNINQQFEMLDKKIDSLRGVK